VLDSSESPSLPVSVIADIAAGTYPAVVNILLGLRKAERTGQGEHIQVSMAHNLQVLSYGYFATHQAGGGWPKAGAELLTGGSPRYQIYATSDGRHIACAALEQKFWTRLVEIVGLDPKYHSDEGQETAVIAALREVIVEHPSGHWRDVLDGEDVCAVVVSSWDEAVAAGLVVTDGPAHVTEPRGDQRSFATLPSPLSSGLRRPDEVAPYPSLADLPPNPWV
ncbi:CoA transferase, partial [Aeromicrobium sp.]|uniref:CoA transferase n=1 Tax=Aeromicrobium sp. TaxID=1871063 RepID=UPI00198AA2B0